MTACDRRLQSKHFELNREPEHLISSIRPNLNYPVNQSFAFSATAANVFGASSMAEPAVRRPILAELYEQYLADRDQAAFVHRVAGRYHAATLERLILHPSRWVRRASVLALGAIGDYSSNTTLGSALVDIDRGVRTLSEAAIRAVWCRDGSW